MQFLIGVILILIQGLMPKIHLTDNLVVSLDVFLIYLTFLALIYETSYIIVFAFILGLFQDFVINIDIIGITSFLKPLTVYLVSVIKSTKFIWNFYFKIIYLFSVFLLYFLCFYFTCFFDTSLLLQVSFFHSLFTLIIFVMIDKTIYKTDFFVLYPEATLHR